MAVSGDGGKEVFTLDSVLEKALKDCEPKSARDVIVVAVHSNLLAAGYQCTGPGDLGERQQGEVPVSSAASLRLPVQWNQSQDTYSLQYLHERSRNVCYLKVIAMDDDLLITAAVGEKEDGAVSFSVKVGSYVREGGSFSTPGVYMNLLQLMTLISRDLETKLTAVCERLGHHSCSSTDSERPPPEAKAPQSSPQGRVNPLISSGPSRPPGQVDPLRREPDLLIDRGPFGYGDRDRLPPFGGGGDFGMPGGGGGMIFDPLRQGGGGGQGRYGPRGPFPPGHPPGARYDPVSPFGLPRPRPPQPGHRNYGPDPDHLPPPGYDDMFM